MLGEARQKYQGLQVLLSPPLIELDCHSDRTGLLFLFPAPKQWFDFCSVKEATLQFSLRGGIVIRTEPGEVQV
jgi:hypothetical protein